MLGVVGLLLNAFICAAFTFSLQNDRKFIDVDYRTAVGSRLDSLGVDSGSVSGIVLYSGNPFYDGYDVSDFFSVDRSGIVVTRSLSFLNDSVILLEVFLKDKTKVRTYEICVNDYNQHSTQYGDTLVRANDISNKVTEKESSKSVEKVFASAARGPSPLPDSGSDLSRKDFWVHERVDSCPRTLGRRRRSVRSNITVTIPETKTGILVSLESDYSERFSLKDPAPPEIDINPVLGSVNLKSGHRLDYEKRAEISFAVAITRVDNPAYYDEQHVTIRLTDENDEVPEFRNVPRPYLAMVSTNAPVGTSVFQLMAQDPDRGSVIRYNLESGGENRFEVDRETGVVRTKGSPLFPRGKEYEIGVSVQDVSAPTLQKSPTQSLKILVGERDPQFFETHYEASFPETADKQFTIIEIQALSHQGLPIMYELTTESGAQSNEFAIDQRTGVVDLLRKLDHEKDAHQYHLKVKAVENRRSAGTSVVNLVINLIDTNDNAPTFPLSQYIVQGFPETVPIGTEIIQVIATDLDSAANAQLTYSVSDDNFTVETINNVGKIKTARRLDYDAILDHTYNFTVTAVDNGSNPLSGSAGVRVSVTNVNDENPVFMQTIEYIQVSEDAPAGTVVHVIQAYDPDGDDVTYSFRGGRTTSRPFSVDANSGIITLLESLDKSRETYRLNVTATDNGQCCGGGGGGGGGGAPSSPSRTSHGLVVVEIKDINNNAPRFADCSSYAPVVLEKANVNTFVIQVRALDSDVGPNGNISYSLVKSSDHGIERFNIDAFTGIITTSDVFDREGKIGVTDFGVTVKAEDHGSPALAGFCTFRIKIGDINDNPPVFNLHEYLASIEESSPIGRRVKQVYATDRDTGENSKIDYSIRHDPSGFFAMNPYSGWVTVARPMTGQQKVTLEIEARDRGEQPRSATVRMEIEITQTTNEYPQWIEDYSAAAIRVSENAPVNFEVKRFRARSTVPDSSLNYFISPGETPDQNGDPKSFYSRVERNEMVLMTYRPLDFETLSKYTLTIKAANRAVSPLHIDVQVNIELVDENDEIPQFIGLDENGRYPGSIAENLRPGTEVITVTATDKDSTEQFKAISYRIKEKVGEDYHKFTIDAQTGTIRTRSSFDRELKSEYYFTVLALDGAPSNRANHHLPGTPNQGEAEVQIRITDTNDNAPFFRDTIYTARVPENTDIGTVIMTVTAEDSDEENTLSYSITEGNRHSAFEVVPDLGEIKVRGHLDYEAGMREYRMKYRVFDDKFANWTTVVVQILDVNDNPPKFDNAIYNVLDLTEEESGISKSNPKYLLSVRAVDPDVDRKSTLRYSLTGQFADDGTFIVNAHTGEISLTRSLDRDPHLGRPMWNFNVLAHDEVDAAAVNQPSLTGYAEVRVILKDVNDNAPVFDRNRLVGRVQEHSRAGMTVLTVIATDADNGLNGTVSYSLKEVPRKNGHPLFAINDHTGHISTTLTDVLDREVQDQYQVVVLARDRGVPSKSSSANITVVIEDINDQTPKFTQPLYRATMSESLPAGASVTSVSATDADTGVFAKLMYSLKLEDREFFTIASVDATNTGVLKVHKPVDFDSLLTPVFNVTVYVQDNDMNHVDAAFIEVQVTDANDNSPVFNPNQQRVTVYENVTVGTTLHHFVASDRDTGINRQFSFAIDRTTDPEKKFAINNDGLITTAKTLDRETKSDHRVHILAIDKGFPPQTGTGTLFVTLNDVNDNFPEFAGSRQAVVYENQPPGRLVMEVSAVDRDIASNGPPFEFKLPCNNRCPCEENPTCGHFAFRFQPGGGENGHGSAIITTLREFDREKQKEYLMPIVMRDSGIPSMSGTNTLTIIIGDVNDNHHYSGHKNIQVYNYKGLFENAFLGSVFAEDEDDWDIDNKTFAFEDENTANHFRLDQTSGRLYMNGKVAGGVYSFRVKVYDAVWRREVVSSVTVKIVELKEKAVRSSGSLRLRGCTAEEFISKPKPNGRSDAETRSRYDLLRDHLARNLGVPVENVDIFTVRDHPSIPRTIDVRYSAHGSPFYQPAKLDGRLANEKSELEKLLGLDLVMTPVDECLEEVCDGAGCTSVLVISNEPLIVNANQTSIVGVTSYVDRKCTCGARDFSSSSSDDGDDVRCHAGSCFNGGTCHQLDHGFRCSCPGGGGFNGPRCQQTHKGFLGNGWAWYRPLTQCTDSHTSVEFITEREDGLLLYAGPTTEPSAAAGSDAKDFLLLELRNGFPLLRINRGSGEAKLAINGMDSNGHVRLRKLNDGQWHRVDIIVNSMEVQLMVDRCESIVTRDDRNSVLSVTDSRPCRVSAEMSGESLLVNVNQPLQVGGRSDRQAAYPPYATREGFHGCIKNLVHNGELYDLHTGNSGEHKDSTDGCPAEAFSCGLENSAVSNCGVNGTCVGSFFGNFHCICLPGWRGPKCSIPTTTKDFQDRSFVEWNFKEQFYAEMTRQLHRLDLQLMFRTRQSSGLLLKAQNSQKLEYAILEISNFQVRFRFNLGTGEQQVVLTYVNVSDGDWHSVFVSRVGQWVVLRVDGGEGRCFNESFGRREGRVGMQISQLGLLAGGDVKFPAADSQPLVDNDFNNGCLNDVRFNGDWLPMDQSQNGESHAAHFSPRSRNVRDGCPSDACAAGNIVCPYGLLCFDLWRFAECRCPLGRRLVVDSEGEVCLPVNECVEQPSICYEGLCFDLEDGYRCDCRTGFGGPTCAERRDEAAAYVTTSAWLIILLCIILLLILVLAFIVYARRKRRPRFTDVVNADDDIRENIINYDEEGVGEQDQTAFDINQLKKPIGEPHLGQHRGERTVLPSTLERPRFSPRFASSSPDVNDYMNGRLNDADSDPSAPPFESVREYAYEGEGSVAGSLSSVASASDPDADQDWDYLNGWGPRFHRLADMYNNSGAQM